MNLKYSEKKSNLYDKYVELNYDMFETSEPTESITTYKPTYKPTSQNKILNYTCNCNVERKDNKNILIITTSITTSLSFMLFLLLIWYKYFYKKRVFTYIYNNETNSNFGIEYSNS
jgi:hypothetical protein